MVGMSAVAVLESALCPWSGPRLGGSLVTPVHCFFMAAVKIFKPLDPTLFLYPPAPASGRVALQARSVPVSFTAMPGLGVVALAARAPAMPENHPAGPMGQTEARWGCQEGHQAGTQSSVWCPGI